jgi:tripartite-type tricarboxylate transporter receptor subunit TctC
MKFQKLITAALGLATVFAVSTAKASDFPNQPITLVVPYSAGGATDAMFRALANAASAHFPQPVVVVNRAGGSGSVAISYMLGRPADGYTVNVIVPVLQRASYQNEFSFDVVKDIKPVIQVGGLQYGIVVRADSPFQNLTDLVEFAKANPGELSYMSAGVGSGGHIYMQEIAEKAGGNVKFNHIPTQGDTNAAQALLGGHVDAIAVTPGGWSGLVEAGDLRLLATLGEERTQRFPNAPTVREQGFDVVHLTPLGLAVHPNTPDDIVQKLHDGFKKAMDENVFLESMNQRENAVMYLGSADYVKAWAESYIEEGKRAKMLADN